jgi:hypothetical protein
MLSDLHDHLDRELAVTAAVRLAVGHVSTKLDGPPPLRQALPAARPDSLKATIGLEHNPEEQE